MPRHMHALGEPVLNTGSTTDSNTRNQPQPARLIGESAAMTAVRSLMAKVASSEMASVLILGQSGTGKELVARGIHDLSRRADKPFVPLNCGAIPGELLESELFGHEKGAFTGALTRRRGRFELADGGTLFLDEIGDMPLAMQVKLLRVLQDRSFERVGGSQTLTSDLRIVAATHRDIEGRIADGMFREDLFYRLNVFPIQMPALRERLEDVPQLVRHFQSQLAEPAEFTPAALAALQAYDWPGNVRELGNLVERMGIMQPGHQVRLHDLPERYLQGQMPTDLVAVNDPKPLQSSHVALEEPRLPTLPEEGVNLKEYLASIEISLVQQALRRTNGIVAHGAELLGLRRTTLVEKIKKYRIDLDAI